ncbi:MAG: glycine oxidase ThiO [Sporichthyaceae bacterium]
MPEVVIVGGGVIGLATAWRGAQRGFRVIVVDPTPGAGTSHVAAGMLAAVTEAQYTERALLALNLAAAAGYEAFTTELTERTGLDTGYARCATLLVGADAGDLALVREAHGFVHSLGCSVELVDSRALRRMEPMLAPGLRGGMLAPADHQVDPRRLVAALLAACRDAGVSFVAERAQRLVVTGGRARGVVTGDGATLLAEAVVLAAGCWSGALDGIPPGVLAPLRPVKGQLLRLRVPVPYRPVLRHTVRAWVAGSPVYLVARPDGELVIGATSEELGFDTRVTAGAVYDLLRDARVVLPSIAEREVTQILAGLRPATADNAPLIGPSGLPGLLMATGHHRNGVLLAAITAEILTAALAGEQLPHQAAAFDPRRFTAARAPATAGRIVLS